MSQYNKEYWDRFYGDNDHIPKAPSSFAEYVLPKIDAAGNLVELGCGNGRDALYFARKGVSQVVAVDLSHTSIEALNDVVKGSAASDASNGSNLASHIRFVCGDFGALPSAVELGLPTLDTVYSRFTLHAVNKPTATSALKWAAEQLRSGGKLCIEARSVLSSLYGRGEPVQDEPDAFILTHYRRFIRSAELLEEIKALGFDVIDFVEAAGLAIYKDDDPVVVRVLAVKK